MNRRKLLHTAAAFAPLAIAQGLVAEAAFPRDIDAETVYELRVYHMNPGKLPLILDRFRTHETRIFARLGMTNIAFWTQTEPVAENGTLIYLLRHKSRAAAKASWDAFKTDPEWVALKATTEKDGTFVSAHESTFLQLTDFSPKL